MSKYLDTMGEQILSVAICDRCHQKRPYTMLVPDGNSPGLRVCKDKPGCRDEFDPWRLPPRQPENITLLHPRPDEPLVVKSD